MSELFFTSDSLLTMLLRDGGVILFGVYLFLFGATLVLLFALRAQPSWWKWLFATVSIQTVLLIGMIVLDLFADRPSFVVGELSSLSQAFSTHRLLLIQAPVLLHICVLLTLGVYQQRLGEAHARSYRTLVTFCVLASFVLSIIIAGESIL